MGGFWDAIFGGSSRKKVKRNPKRKEPKINQGQRTRQCPQCGGRGEVDVIKKGWIGGQYTDVSVREMCGTCHYRGVVPY